ncbi:DedA family protein [Anaerobacillus alkaliphilus]|uniref:DedA family protein n=1 Tax=Anaerobacillus alkaliphilus TaxID=1548597 RepID=A0A4Q0VRE6_9BACI|nr:DedA family protein [Anaerobacillus alkaliphilus]RXI99820.1 DedA family protein [Anaerobacillus alkaliphilus]
MEDILRVVIQFVRSLSYFGIVLALSCELIPAEIVLPLAGFWVYEGDMKFWLVVMAGTVGGTLGPIVLYIVGRFGGRPFLRKYGKYIFIKEKQIKSVDYFFEKYGGGVAFLGRFIPGVRTFIPIPCGIAKMNIGLFVLYTFVAMFPISFLYVWLGVKFGPRWQAVAPLANEFFLEIILIVVGLVSAFLGFKHMFKNETILNK